MSKILDTLLLGDIFDAKEFANEEHPPIFVTCSAETKPFFPDSLKLNLKDDDLEDLETTIIECFDVSSKFIHVNLENGKTVFVHCAAGMSRAPTIVINYFMTYRGMTFEEAYKFVKGKRKVVDIADHYEKVLREKSDKMIIKK